MTRKDFPSHLPRCWQCGWRFENETTKITNYSRDFFFPNFHPLSVLGIQITRVWGYSLPPSGLIEIKRKSYNCIIFCVCSNAYLSRPILVEIFSRWWSYNKMLIDVSLVWLSFMKQGPRCARSVGHDPEPNFSSRPTLPLKQMSTQYFGFVRHTVITNDVIEREKMKSVILFYSFLIMNFRLKCWPLWKVWFSSQDRPQYNLSFFL